MDKDETQDVGQGQTRVQGLGEEHPASHRASEGVVKKEAARRVAWKENAVGTQLMPGGGKVWQWYTPVGMFLIDVGLITEAIWTIRGFREVPLVEMTFMFVHDLRI